MRNITIDPITALDGTLSIALMHGRDFVGFVEQRGNDRFIIQADDPYGNATNEERSGTFALADALGWAIQWASGLYATMGVTNRSYVAGQHGCVEEITHNGVNYLWANNTTNGSEQRFGPDEYEAAMNFAGILAHERPDARSAQAREWQQEVSDYQATQATESVDALSAAGF